MVLKMLQLKSTSELIEYKHKKLICCQKTNKQTFMLKRRVETQGDHAETEFFEMEERRPQRMQRNIIQSVENRKVIIL